MKYLFFFLFTISVFAQNPNPDTLFLVNGKSYPCLVTAMDNNKIDITYMNNRSEKVLLGAVQKITLEGMGVVYTVENGFSKDRTVVNTFIEKRLNKIDSDEQIRKEQERLAKSFNDNQDTINAPGKQKAFMRDPQEYNRWSFGVLLIPYYSGKIYYFQKSTSYPVEEYVVYSTASNEVNMEAQLSYALTKKIRLTLDAGYTSTYYEQRSETHYRDNNSNYGNDYGTLQKEDISLLNINLGVKYYFKQAAVGNVSIYGLIGIGKQFAFAEEKNEILFQQPSPNVQISEDNRDEYLEDLNSPFHFNMGFGAEYYFNESLTLTSNIRFIYSRVEAKYDSRTITESQSNSSVTDYKKSDFLTRIGLGVNFYF